MKKFAVLAIAVSALAICSEANAVHIKKQQQPSTQITGTTSSTNSIVAVPETGGTLLLFAGALTAMIALRYKLAR